MLYKSCRELHHRSIVPTHLPYVVSLVRFYETDAAIFLQLQHAAGGRLWSYVGAYLNQCTESTANAYCNVEPHRPVSDQASVKKERMKSNGIGSSVSQKCVNEDLCQVPSSADSLATLASIECTESGVRRELKSKASSDMGSLDEGCSELVDRKVSVASFSECSSQGFGEILRSANPEMKYFRIDSSDSSEHTSRQVSCSSAEDNFCRIHCITMSFGICRFCAEADTPQPASSSDTGTNSLEEAGIYDASHAKTVIDTTKPMQDNVGSSASYRGGSTLTDEGTDQGGPRAVEVDQSRYLILRPSSQERSFDSGERRRRRRTLSSAFGELDLAESAAASGATPLRPLVHLPESCVRQWAAEMVVAISRLHSIGIVCRQVDLNYLYFNYVFFTSLLVRNSVAVFFSLHFGY